jgi:hypothetical protein
LLSYFFEVFIFLGVVGDSISSCFMAFSSVRVLLRTEDIVVPELEEMVEVCSSTVNRDSISKLGWSKNLHVCPELLPEDAFTKLAPKEFIFSSASFRLESQLSKVS